MCARIGGVSAPYVLLLGDNQVWLPLVIWTCLNLSLFTGRLIRFKHIKSWLFNPVGWIRLAFTAWNSWPAYTTNNCWSVSSWKTKQERKQFTMTWSWISFYFGDIICTDYILCSFLFFDSFGTVCKNRIFADLCIINLLSACRGRMRSFEIVAGVWRVFLSVSESSLWICISFIWIVLSLIFAYSRLFCELFFP